MPLGTPLCADLSVALSLDSSEVACLTVALAAAREEGCEMLALPQRVSPGAMRPPEGEKADTDAADAWPNVRYSDNFALKWGDGARIEDDFTDAILSALEVAWAAEVVDRVYPEPPGADAYLLNVFIGDTGDGTPTAAGAAGYMNVDQDGRSYMVLSRDVTDGVASTIAHELFHGIQQGAGTAYRYDSRSPAAWYWEATAMWIEGEVYPGDSGYYQFLWAYASYAYLPLNFFEYWENGADLTAYRQYGAGIYPRFLSEIAADGDLVRTSWVEAGDEEDPLVVIAAGLAARGLDFDQVFSDFAAHNLFWAYADGEEMFEVVDDYADWAGSPWAVTVYESDDGRVPEELQPENLGTSNILIDIDAGDVATVVVEGDAAGSRGGTPLWDMRAVRSDGGTSTFLPERAADGRFEVVVEGSTTLGIAVSVLSGLSTGESAGYAYDVVIEPVEEDDDDDAPKATPPEELAGCGCESGGRGGGWGLFLAVGLILATRRR